MAPVKHSILFLSHSDDGGAGIANVNIAKAFIELGNEVQFLVVRKTSQNNFIDEMKHKVKKRNLTSRIRFLFNETREKKNNIKYCYYNKNEQLSHFQIDEIIQNIKIKPTIILAGWISYFINLDTLGKLAVYLKAQPYIIMNDMSPITGGCHYTWECRGYKNDCSNCPALEKYENKNTSKKNLILKKDAILKYGIKVIAGSKLMFYEAQDSFLYKSQETIKIVNGIINLKLFNSTNKEITKELFGFNNGKKTILVGAKQINDIRKGFDKFSNTLSILNEMLENYHEQIIVIMVGDNNNYNFDLKNIEVIKFEYISSDFFLSLLYKAADLYVCTSIEDSGPVMVIEALASGIPVIGFDLGFVSEFIKNNENGFVIPKYELEAMAKYIIHILYHTDLDSMRINARKSIIDAFSPTQLVGLF